jgi:3-methyladenine DNA glycosylase AlkD
MKAADAFVRDVERRLEPLADPARARDMAAYMKNRFVFLGVPAPARRAATRALIDAFDGEALAAAEALWRKPSREYQYVACDLLTARQATLAGRDLPRLARLVRTRSWWDTVDGLAKIAGDIVRRAPREIRRMDAWIDHPDLWLRRAALLHQLAWKKDTDRARLFRYCLKRAHETEFFVAKAVGWALRQYSWTEPEALRAFLARHGDRLVPLARREAGKHLGKSARPN